MIIINKEKSYRELNENIRVTKSQISNNEKNNLIEEGKKQVLMKLLNATNNK